MMKKTLRILRNAPLHYLAHHTIAKLDNGDYITDKVPYVCQFASPNLAKDILEKHLDAKDDPNWRIFGYKTQEESSYWAWRQCGICCVKMALDYYGIDKPVATLTEEGVRLGGYDTDNDQGWYYKPAAKLLGEFGVLAKVVPHFTIKMLAKHLLFNNLAIISVNPEIIRSDKVITNRDKSGHLVLAVGFRIKNNKIKGFFIHNPSGKSKDSQGYAFISIERFKQAYGQRGISISGLEPSSITE